MKKSENSKKFVGGKILKKPEIFDSLNYSELSPLDTWNSERGGGGTRVHLLHMLWRVRSRVCLGAAHVFLNPDSSYSTCLASASEHHVSIQHSTLRLRHRDKQVSPKWSLSDHSLELLKILGKRKPIHPPEFLHCQVWDSKLGPGVLLFYAIRTIPAGYFVLTCGCSIYKSLVFLIIIILRFTRTTEMNYFHSPVRGYDTNQTSSGRTSRFTIRSPISSYFGGSNTFPGFTSIRQFSTPKNLSSFFSTFSSTLSNLIGIFDAI